MIQIDLKKNIAGINDVNVIAVLYIQQKLCDVSNNY